MGYFKHAAKGITWMGALRATIRGLTFVRLAILARLLSPQEFGLFGIASIFLALLEIITETGINVFFIQKEGELDEYKNAAFVVSIFRGLVISLILVATAPFVVKFFHSPQSLSLILLISIVPFIRGFINPAVVKFQRDLEFNKEFLLRVLIFIGDTLVAITVGIITKSAICLVLGMITGVVIEVIISQMMIKPRPKFEFNTLKIKHIFSRGKWVTLSGVLQYIYSNTDSIVIGRMLNTLDLGYYQMAYKISTLPITEISDIFYKVTFPVFVRFNDDKERLRKAFLKTLLTVSVLVIPIGLCLFFFSKEIVMIVLGEKWMGIVNILKILSIYGIVRAASGEFPALFLSVKKQEYVMFVSLFSVIVILISIIPLVLKYGVIGAGISVLIGTVLTLPLIVYFSYKILKS
jgi:lipopolysaccharide exporter